MPAASPTRAFDVRGVVEGFYGTPWSHDARRRAVSFLAARGMNAYVYAPKDDPFHRARWRDPYPPAEHADLVGLLEHCTSEGVRFGFAVSPGLDIDYDDPDDRETLARKLAAFVEAGLDWVVLAFDDVPLRPGAGRGQAGLAASIRQRLPEARLSVVPTDYVGTRPSRYLDELTGDLPPGTDLLWTGTTVVPRTITVAEARERRQATAGFPLLVWDNYPVNDAFMEASLHLGPLRGRDPDLVEECVGILANPMVQPAASLVPLGTAAEFLADPDAYDPDEAWERALHAVGGDAHGALVTLARACVASALTSASDDPLHRLIDELEGGAPDALDAIEAELRAAGSLPGALDGGLPEGLADEVRPWAEQAAREAAAGQAAVSVLRGGGDEPWSGVLTAMGMLVAWSAARRPGDRVVYGPRFACYPAIVQDADGAVAIDPEAAVVEDANAVDRLCRTALRSAGANA